MHLSNKLRLQRLFKKLSSHKHIKTFENYDDIKLRRLYFNKKGTSIFYNKMFTVPNCEIGTTKPLSYSMHSFNTLLANNVNPISILRLIENDHILRASNIIHKKITQHYIYELPFLDQNEIIKKTPKTRIQILSSKFKNTKVVKNKAHKKDKYLDAKEMVYLRSRIARNDVNCVFEFRDPYCLVFDKKHIASDLGFSTFKSPLKRKKPKLF